MTRKSAPKQKIAAAKKRKIGVKKILARKATRKAVKATAKKMFGVSFVAAKLAGKAAKKSGKLGKKAVGKVDKIMGNFRLW